VLVWKRGKSWSGNSWKSLPAFAKISLLLVLVTSAATYKLLQKCSHFNNGICYTANGKHQFLIDFDNFPSGFIIEWVFLISCKFVFHTVRQAASGIAQSI
jgi:hypothetical protein